MVIVKTPNSVIPPWSMSPDYNTTTDSRLESYTFQRITIHVEVRVWRILGRCTSARTDFFTLQV